LHLTDIHLIHTDHQLIGYEGRSEMSVSFPLATQPRKYITSQLLNTYLFSFPLNVLQT